MPGVEMRGSNWGYSHC